MTLRDIQALADAPLANRLISIAGSVVAGPTTFGLTAPQAAAMEAAAELFESQLADWDASIVSHEAASLAKNDSRAAALNTFSTFLNLVYATPTVTEATLASIGLSPRSDSRLPLKPQTPQDLLAVPFADGTVKLTWKKGDNKYGIFYQVQTAGADESDWANLQATTRQSMTVSGVTPGEPRWFRVKAYKNGLESEFSYNAGVYIPTNFGEENVEAA